MGTVKGPTMFLQY